MKIKVLFSDKFSINRGFQLSLVLLASGIIIMVLAKATLDTRRKMTGTVQNITMLDIPQHHIWLVNIITVVGVIKLMGVE